MIVVNRRPKSGMLSVVRGGIKMIGAQTWRIIRGSQVRLCGFLVVGGDWGNAGM